MAATITVDAILRRAATMLQDQSNRRWTLSELLNWFNDGQRAIVLRKPNASVKNINVALVAGTKQSIPPDGVQLLDVVRNESGAVITIVERAILDSQMPTWHTASANDKVQHYCHNDRDLKNYYVYPPNTGKGSIELVYCVAPADAALNGTITLDDIYEPVLLDFIMGRAYSKDSEYTADPTRAAMHFTAFDNALGGQVRVEAGNSPRTGARSNSTLATR
jgi:hypothetical protein